jgi:hypothetical protein
VPDTEEGTEIEVSAVAKDTDDPALVRLDLTATCHGVKVLAQAKAVIKRP